MMIDRELRALFICAFMGISIPITSAVIFSYILPNGPTVSELNSRTAPIDQPSESNITIIEKQQDRIKTSCE